MTDSRSSSSDEKIRVSTNNGGNQPSDIKEAEKAGGTEVKVDEVVPVPFAQLFRYVLFIRCFSFWLRETS